MYFQIVNAWNYVYEGLSVTGIGLPRNILVLDFDDLVVEAVCLEGLPIDYFRHVMNISSWDYQLTGKLTLIDSHLVSQTFNPYIQWGQLLEGKIHKLTFFGRVIKLTSRLRRTLSTGDSEYHVTFGETLLMQFLCAEASEPAIQIEYAFICGHYLIIRLSIRIMFKEAHSAGTFQIPHSRFHYMFSMVFTGTEFKEFLGVYCTWQHPNFLPKIYKALDSSLEAKLLMLLKDTY